MKKKTLPVLLTFTILLGSCVSCSREKPDIPVSLTYRNYVEQVAIQNVGELHFENLSLLPVANTHNFPIIFTDTCVWTRGGDTNNQLHHFALSDSKADYLGVYPFRMTLDQYAALEDGSVWGSYSDKEDKAALVRFDTQTGAFYVERTWDYTSGFIKLVGYQSSLYIFRAEILEDSRRYIIEKYVPSSKQSTLLEERIAHNGSGDTIYALDIENDAVYALICTTQNDTRAFYINRYDLDGNLITTYSMPEYDDAFRAIHKSPLDMEVFGDYVGIKSLQSYSTFFQLQKGTVRRIFFTNNRAEAEKQVDEMLMPLSHIDNESTPIPYMVFYWDKKLIVYDLENTLFKSIELDTKDASPFAVNSNLDVLFTAPYNSESPFETSLYITNIKRLIS